MFLLLSWQTRRAQHLCIETGTFLAVSHTVINVIGLDQNLLDSWKAFVQMSRTSLFLRYISSIAISFPFSHPGGSFTIITAPSLTESCFLSRDQAWNPGNPWKEMSPKWITFPPWVYQTLLSPCLMEDIFSGFLGGVLKFDLRIYDKCWRYCNI